MTTPYRMKLHPKSGLFVGQVIRLRFQLRPTSRTCQKTEGGIIKPDSAFLLTGRCGDRPYANRGFDRSFILDQTGRLR